MNELRVRCLPGLEPDNPWTIRISVDGQPLDEELASATIDAEALYRSSQVSGAYEIFTCSCGIAQCGGWRPVDVHHDVGVVTWHLQYPIVRAWRFAHDAYVREATYAAMSCRSCLAALQDATYRRAPLVWAIREGHDTIAHDLVEARLHLDARAIGGESPALAAVRAGSASLLRALVEAGAKVDFADRDGVTALHVAVERGAREMVEGLLVAGAALDAEDLAFRQTALHLAVKVARPDLAVVLIEAGASPRAVDIDGWTPLDWAEYEHAEELVALLAPLGPPGRTPIQRDHDRFRRRSPR
jgi:ankyrin repeat protein